MENYYIFFRNLANPLRIEILSLLKEKPSSVNELAKKMKIEQSKLSHALAGLRRCSILQVSKKGKKRVYSLNKETVLPILNLIDKHEKKFCKVCHALRSGK